MSKPLARIWPKSCGLHPPRSNTTVMRRWPRRGRTSARTLGSISTREAALLDERRNLPCYVAAFEQPVGYRLRPLLPAAYSRIRRQPVLKENELAAWFQDAS